MPLTLTSDAAENWMLSRCSRTATTASLPRRPTARGWPRTSSASACGKVLSCGRDFRGTQRGGRSSHPAELPMRVRVARRLRPDQGGHHLSTDRGEGHEQEHGGAAADAGSARQGSACERAHGSGASRCGSVGVSVGAVAVRGAPLASVRDDDAERLAMRGREALGARRASSRVSEPARPTIRLASASPAMIDASGVCSSGGESISTMS